MQFSRYLTYHKSRSQLSVWPWVLKVILAVASFYYTISKLVEEQLAFSALIGLFNSIEFVFLILLITFLMLINWVLESKKWQIIAKSHQPISLFKALKAILTGVSLDAILPFGAGAVGSKLFSLEGAERHKLITPIVLAQGIQSFFTVLFGTVGLYQLASATNLLAIYGGLKTLLLIGVLGIVLVYVILKFWPTTVKSIIKSAKKIPRHIWFKIIIISLFRYLVFFAQLLLLCMYMAPKIPIGVLVGCVTWMFFAKTIIPKPGHLGALGIRGASVVFFLTLAGYGYGSVVMATLVLWVINLAIPSLIGLFFVKELNFRTEKEL